MAREYKRFYSWRRVAAAALAGVFRRHRMLTRAQRGFVSGLGVWRRLYWLGRFQAEYRFAPVTFLAIGRKRVREFMRDPDYAAYLARLREMSRPLTGGEGRLSAK
jgi:hypothetical protein